MDRLSRQGQLDGAITMHARFSRQGMTDRLAVGGLNQTGRFVTR
jgi:hypothetical protein